VCSSDLDRSGTGQKYADQASAKYGAQVIMPPEPGDANDYVQAGHDLKALLYQASSENPLEKLKVVFGDQLGDEYEPPDELVEGLLTLCSLTVLYGDSNSGKTFFALSLATAPAQYGQGRRATSDRRSARRRVQRRSVNARPCPR
jgi:hypothetical protein